jgi:hypothetical protein
MNFLNDRVWYKNLKTYYEYKNTPS